VFGKKDVTTRDRAIYLIYRGLLGSSALELSPNFHPDREVRPFRRGVGFLHVIRQQDEVTGGKQDSADSGFRASLARMASTIKR
jgi:hypothetical protein